MGEAADVVVAGVSARALAESAAIAGYRVAAVDGYGDLDLLARARCVSLRRDLGVGYTAHRAAAVAVGLGTAAAAYGSNFENYPDAVAALAAGRELLGNAPAVLARVRNPVLLMRRLRARGLPAPATRRSAPGGAAAGTAWLRKPRKSGGGGSVVLWRPGMPVPRGAYLQEWIEGVPGSIVFVADGRRAAPLGLSRQLVGEPLLGADGFRYCGSLLAGGAALFEGESELADRAAALAQVVTEEFGLVGVNGIDFIARDGVPYPVEVNPRFSASMELVERAHGVSIFGLHAEACRGALPGRTPYLRSMDAVAGKAIVFARDEVVMGHMRRWWRDQSVRDVPHPGERIGAGRPICTVFARGADEAACLRALLRRAASAGAAGVPAGRSVA